MTKLKLGARRKRVERMNRILEKLYPDPRVALHYGSAWELLVAVILSAQCTDERVNRVTEHLFKKYRTMSAYAYAPTTELEKMIYSCGFYRNKAKNIQAAARRILDTYGGMVPDTMDELTTLPGVARKTANIVLSNVYGKHEGIAVDTHVRRFAIRFDLSDYTDPVRIERDLCMIMPRKYWWGFNHRLVMYGRNVCPARKHVCKLHPLTVVYPKADTKWPRAK